MIFKKKGKKYIPHTEQPLELYKLAWSRPHGIFNLLHILSMYVHIG